jgi:hypothetical protein
MHEDLRRGFVNSTIVMSLTEHLSVSSGWDYLTVEVGDGDFWLLSRLFGFVTMYVAQRPLPCIVFVRSVGGRERLLGIGEPAPLCGALARLYPWFNETLAGLLVEKQIPVIGTAPVEVGAATELMTGFVARLQTQDDKTGDPDWSQLSFGAWEHTEWLREEMLRDELRPALLDPNQSRMRRAAAPADDALVLDILGRNSPFVALVDDSDTFLQLYDKRRIFERVKERIERRAN